MRLILSKFLTLAWLLPTSIAHAAPLCPNAHAHSRPGTEVAAYLRHEGQASLPDSFYLELREEMRKYKSERDDGRKMDHLINNRALDPSYRYQDGASLLEVASLSAYRETMFLCSNT